MTSPYVTPSIIANAPTGVPWTIIPEQGASDLAKFAEQTNMCWRTTAEVDRICNQPLRATLDTEEETGPDFRVTIDSQGVAHMLASRWPILSVVGAQVSPAAAFPPAWQVLPPDSVRRGSGVIGAYGTTTPGTGAQGQVELDIAPGWVTWYAGRNGTKLQVAYLNGWPHAGLTGNVDAGALMLPVDDVTGMAGAAPFLYDGANTEQVTVNAVTALASVTTMGVQVPVGPGWLNLAAPTRYAHTVTSTAAVLASSMPADIQLASLCLVAAEAVDAGIEGIVISEVRGVQQSSFSGSAALLARAEKILHSYRRAL